MQLAAAFGCKNQVLSDPRQDRGPQTVVEVNVVRGDVSGAAAQVSQPFQRNDELDIRYEQKYIFLQYLKCQH